MAANASCYITRANLCIWASILSTCNCAWSHPRKYNHVSTKNTKNCHPEKCHGVKCQDKSTSYFTIISVTVTKLHFLHVLNILPSRNSAVPHLKQKPSHNYCKWHDCTHQHENVSFAVWAGLAAFMMNFVDIYRLLWLRLDARLEFCARHAWMRIFCVRCKRIFTDGTLHFWSVPYPSTPTWQTASQEGQAKASGNALKFF